MCRCILQIQSHCCTFAKYNACLGKYNMFHRRMSHWAYYIPKEIAGSLLQEICSNRNIDEFVQVNRNMNQSTPTVAFTNMGLDSEPIMPYHVDDILCLVSSWNNIFSHTLGGLIFLRSIKFHLGPPSGATEANAIGKSCIV
jgi:hypothetical protein